MMLFPSRPRASLVHYFSFALLVTATLAAGDRSTQGQSTPRPDPTPFLEGTDPADPPQAQSATANRIDAFRRLVSGAVLDGTYTDNEGKVHRDRYEIHVAQPIGDTDRWLFQARIQFGSTDVTLPVPLVVKWLGRTPVITLEDVTLPGLGTFNAYILFDGERYAGTWRHDEKGGHLYGTVVRNDSRANDSAKDQK